MLKDGRGKTFGLLERKQTEFSILNQFIATSTKGNPDIYYLEIFGTFTHSVCQNKYLSRKFFFVEHILCELLLESNSREKFTSLLWGQKEQCFKNSNEKMSYIHNMHYLVA